jgi:hypothetical protein
VKHRFICCAVAAAALGAASSAAADPLIIMSPNPAKTGAKNEVTFSTPIPATSYSWDLNGDGIFGDKDGSATVKWAYDLPGDVNVGLRYSDGTGTHDVVETLRVNGLPVSFVVFPSPALPGQEITFAYSGGPAVSSPPEWDLNGDGVFPDATGPGARTTFAAPGTYFVGLRLTDVDDAVSTGYQPVAVSLPSGPVTTKGKPQFRLMSPFPIVRITGKVQRKGARIKSLTIRAPYGATVKVRCRGHGCPFHRSSQTLTLAGKAKAPSKTIRIKRFERRLLRRGVSIKVLVMRKGEIGKYTHFLIRGGRPPGRTDLCLPPGSTDPMECPSS